MSDISVKINNDYHKVIDIYANIGGVWKPAMIYANIDGTYTMIDDFTIKESNIVGFKIVYELDKGAKHGTLTNLKYNPMVPCTLAITGSINMDVERQKGVVFQYNNNLESDQLNKDEEGIVKYTASIYALLDNGLIIDVLSTNDRIGFPGQMKDMNLGRNRLGHLRIEASAKLGYEIHGVHTEGWNSIFCGPNEIGNLVIGHESEIYMSDLTKFNIYPEMADGRWPMPNIAEIGIARNLHTPNLNMNGSYGYFSHTFNSITVNGVSKPFSVSIEE